jgi:hypothetical protein
MVDEVRAAPGRVVISSEDFASARPQHAAKLVADLGPERVHVLIVARRLDRLLASAWQERVKSVNETRTYDAWLRAVLDPERDSDAAHVFWHNHELAGLVALWREVLPAERVLVLVNDEGDRAVQPRTFERLLGLREGQLTPGPFTNTSFSMERIELCRQLNLAMVRRGWVGETYLNTPHRQMLAGMRMVPVQAFETPVPPLPGWTAPRLAELSDERVRSLRESDAVVLGDPERLRHVGDESAPDLPEPPLTVPVEAAAQALEKSWASALRQLRAQAKELRSAEKRLRREAARPVRPPGPMVAEVSSRFLLREVTRRQLRKLRPGR